MIRSINFDYRILARLSFLGLVVSVLCSCGGAGGAGYDGGNLEGTNIRTIEVSGKIEGADNALITIETSNGAALSTSSDSEGAFDGLLVRVPASIQLTVEGADYSDSVALGSISVSSLGLFIHASLVDGKISNIQIEIQTSSDDPLFESAENDSDNSDSDSHPNRSKPEATSTPAPNATPPPSPIDGGSGTSTPQDPATPAPGSQSAPSESSNYSQSGPTGNSSNGSNGNITVGNGSGASGGSSSSGSSGSGSSGSGASSGSTDTGSALPGGQASFQPVGRG